MEAFTFIRMKLRRLERELNLASGTEVMDFLLEMFTLSLKLILQEYKGKLDKKSNSCMQRSIAVR